MEKKHHTITLSNSNIIIKITIMAQIHFIFKINLLNICNNFSFKFNNIQHRFIFLT